MEASLHVHCTTNHAVLGTGGYPHYRHQGGETLFHRMPRRDLKKDIKSREANIATSGSQLEEESLI